MGALDLSRLVDQFAGLRVLVIGDVMLDSYLEGSADRLCREAPVPIVAVSRRTDSPGGAANAAANLRALGAQVDLLSVVGDDADSVLLRAALAQHDVNTVDIVIDPSRATLAKLRIVANGQLLVRFDQGTESDLAGPIESALAERLSDVFHQVDAVLVSDYSCGILTPTIRQVLARLQAAAPRVLVVDAKDLPAYRTIGATAAKPNYGEAVRMLGAREEQDPRNRADQIEANGQRLLEIVGARVLAVTMDTDGALVFESGQSPYRTYAHPVPFSRVAGAGDTYVAALTLTLAAGAPVPAAAELASAASSLVVRKQGTATCHADELRDEVAANNKLIADPGQLRRRLDLLRQQGQTIVFTNGCFDILHSGHIAFLHRAKALGGTLVVGLNSDASVGRLKGPTRPVNPLADRAQVLAALSSVDYIIPFDDDTSVNLIRAIRPETFVKGGDYTLDGVPEAPAVREYGGALTILPFVAERSTSSLIERIRAVA